MILKKSYELELFPSSSDTLKILQLLISHGVNLNASLDGDGCSALVTAVILDWPDVIGVLLENGANVNDDAMAKTEGSLNSDTISNDSFEQSITTQFIFSKGRCIFVYENLSLFNKSIATLIYV